MFLNAGLHIFEFHFNFNYLKDRLVYIRWHHCRRIRIFSDNVTYMCTLKFVYESIVQKELPFGKFNN